MVVLAYQLKVNGNGSDVFVSLEATSAHQQADYQIQGSPVGASQVREWLRWEYGAFGHLAFEGPQATPLDLATAMSSPRAAAFAPRRISGGELLVNPGPGIPGGAVS